MSIRLSCVGLVALTLTGLCACHPAHPHTTINTQDTPAIATVPITPSRTLEVGALTEEEVIRLAKAWDLDAIGAQQNVALQRAQLETTGLYTNPSLSWESEHFPGKDGEREDAISLTIPVDLSTRRKMNRELAKVKVSEANAFAIATQSDAITESLHLLYEVAGQQKRLQIQEHAVDRLAQALLVVQRQKSTGSVAGYDQTRLEVEVELATSQLAQEKNRLSVLRGQLAARLGIAELQGNIPVELHPEDRLAEKPKTNPASRSITHLRAAVAHSRAALEASTRAWIPTLSLSGGLRVGHDDKTRYGYVGGLSLALPIFDRGQGQKAVTTATDGLMEARVQSAERKTRLRFLRAKQTLSAARLELARFRTNTEDRIKLLGRAAESSYREGERSIIELLDARRARTSVQMRALELMLLVKHAEIELRAAQGEFE